MRAVQPLRSGVVIDLLDPRANLPTLEDIAWGLAHTHRFNGQLEHPLDVATHSMALMSLLPSRLRFRALMHDASEAVLGDVVRPIKAHPTMAVYRDLEYRWQERLYSVYGAVAPWNAQHLDPPELREVDTVLPFHEAEMLGSSAFAHALDCLRRDLGLEQLTREQRALVNPILMRRRDREPADVAMEWLRHVNHCCMEPERFCK